MKELKRDRYGRTELTHYITNKNTKRAVNMIKNADIDFNEPDMRGYTYLHFAVQEIQPEIVKALLDRGAKVNLTPLYNFLRNKITHRTLSNI